MLYKRLQIFWLKSLQNGRWFLFLVTIDSVNLTKGGNTACNPVFSGLPDKDLFNFDFVGSAKKPGWKPNVEDEVGGVADGVNLQIHYYFFSHYYCHFSQFTI